MALDGGYFRFDKARLEAAMIRAGVAPRDLCRRCNCASKTVYKALKGERVQLGSAKEIAKGLRVEDLTALMAGEDSIGPVDSSLLVEWDVAETVSPWLTLSNKIQYRIFQLRHKTLAGELARAKCYDLDNVSFDTQQDAASHLLTRHAQLCRKLAPSVFFPINQSVVPSTNEKQMWVIDTWPAGRSLSDQANELANKTIPIIALQLASALQELHQQNVVLRDLHPNSVFFESATNQTTIVDLELAKLSDGSPTVANGELLENPFRAPECQGPKFDQTADVYSWSRVIAFLASGNPAAFSHDAFPSSISALLRASQSKSYRARPSSFRDILPELRRWAN